MITMKASSIALLYSN